MFSGGDEKEKPHYYRGFSRTKTGMVLLGMTFSLDLNLLLNQPRPVFRKSTLILLMGVKMIAFFLTSIIQLDKKVTSFTSFYDAENIARAIFLKL
jgi:hypothetical protein